MLTLTPAMSPATLAALMPTLELVRRHARERRYGITHGSGLFEETMQRYYAASETSLTLLVNHVLLPLLEPRTEPVNVTEQLRLAVRTLDAMTHAVAPPDQPAPHISLVAGRRCLLCQRHAALLVQVTLAVIQAAILDDALVLVVALPRLVDDRVIVEVEADTAGIAGDDREATSFRQQLAGCMAEIGGQLTWERRPEGFLVTLCLPGAPQRPDEP
jgi:hypothetical protein